MFVAPKYSGSLSHRQAGRGEGREGKGRHRQPGKPRRCRLLSPFPAGLVVAMRANACLFAAVGEREPGGKKGTKESGHLSLSLFSTFPLPLPYIIKSLLPPSPFLRQYRLLRSESFGTAWFTSLHCCEYLLPLFCTTEFSITTIPPVLIPKALGTITSSGLHYGEFTLSKSLGGSLSLVYVITSCLQCCD